MDDSDDFDEFFIEQDDDERSITAIPVLQYYQKTYANSSSDNDQKAIGHFKLYESEEKIRRLRHELQMIAEGRVSLTVLDNVAKKKRKVKYRTYEYWAKLMLQWLAQARR